MNKFDQFLSANKALFIILSILALPFILVWSLIYGVVIGLVGMTVNTYETARTAIRQESIIMLKYPIWRQKEYDISQGKDLKNPYKETMRAPGRMASIILQFFVSVMLYPFLLVWGVIIGPVRAFIEVINWWLKIWANKAA